MLGRSVVSVRLKRRLNYGPLRQRLAWTVREISLLGKRPDSQIAALRGRNKMCVYLKRKFLGIPSYRSSRMRQWTPAQDKLLGTDTDNALAKKFGCGYYLVKERRQALGIRPFSHRRWTPAEEKLVGTLSAQEVARRTGRTLKSVWHRRRALNLPNKRGVKIRSRSAAR